MNYELVEDIARSNQVLALGVSPTLHLAAAVWTLRSTDSVAKTRLACLEHAIGKLMITWPEWQLWLVAGHRTFQPDNRVTRYNSFWKSLERSGISLPKGEYIGEGLQASEEVLRFFGAVRFEPNQLEPVRRIMMSEQAAITFISETQAMRTLPLLVQKGWPARNTKPPEEIVEVVCTQSGLVIDAYGEFDDADIAVAAIGKMELLHN